MPPKNIVRHRVKAPRRIRDGSSFSMKQIAFIAKKVAALPPN